MKNKAIVRGFLGFPIGVFISYTITIVISLVLAQGYYSPASPELVSQCGSQINAVVLQFILSGLLGAVLGAGSVIWENDDWSFPKQSIIHFVITSLTMLPIAYFSHWMEHTFAGIAGYFIIFLAIYIAIWITLYGVWKHSIKQINDKLKNG
ncbi:MAG TPA: DUF3021 domain-containing protein [Clostridium sp.]|jgi:hypothetical protein|uniref:DUF3021 domain-containing protein n=1 Tax=Clostridium lapidicellarium TaxID=3240931 RepID=A0ABV4DZH1_9CLOT|nr:DUF3021 domain-containing protein [uncultured Clostridium sp.]NLU09077.1 DUF3021 domain-containing protein [Clostridiales bacterium]HBC96676.1 DUF3021 domain-containing protein [Clostridium sp.]